MAQKRRYPRWQVFYHLRAFERGSDAALGHVIDISEGGMALGSERVLAVDGAHALWMRLPFEGEPPARLNFDARVVWVRGGDERDLYEYGFEITGLLPRAHLVIEDFIRALQPAD